VATVSCGGTSAGYRFVQRFGKELGVQALCEWLGVSRSGYYDWCKRQPSERDIEDSELAKRIKAIYDANYGRYGSPRIFKALQKQGLAIGQKRVARLMREHGLVARVVKVTRRQPGLKRFIAAGENLRPDGGVPKAMNKVWVADVTYLKVKDRWHYLSAVMDLYSRRIVGWSLNVSRTAATTRKTLASALRKREPEAGLMIHTDRGIEYRGADYQLALKQHGITHSLNRPGQCTDNAHMESFFHTLKGELLRGRSFQSASELRYALSGYINQYYNRKRLHSGIGYCSPMEYEGMAA
jgi:putative transposase